METSLRRSDTVGARSPARHARGRRQLHHEASEGRARGPGMAGGNGSLILVATWGGPIMFARIGVMRALNRHVERVFNARVVLGTVFCVAKRAAPQLPQ